MKNIAEVVTHNVGMIENKLAGMDIETIARQTGVLKRTPRKLSPSKLLLVLTALSPGFPPTLERIASTIRLVLGSSYSKESVRKRLNGKIDQFLITVLSVLFSDMTKKAINCGVLSRFNRVLLHDSTTISLPDRFAARFPGNANGRDRKLSLMKIQLITDLARGCFLNLSLSGFTRNDQAAAPDILDIAVRGDLVLRDLGYFVLKTFRRMMEQGIFFLSRYRFGVSVIDPDTGKPINLRRLLKGQNILDIKVLLGLKEPLPVRLVAIPVSKEIARQRRHKARNNRDKRLKPSADRLFLMGWTIFITNIDRNDLNAEELRMIYNLRWRIEIIFKAWKSHLGIRELNVQSEAMLCLSIVTKLIFCALTQATCTVLEILSPASVHVSLLRVAQIMRDCSSLFAAAILRIPPTQLLLHLIESHAYYEKRTDRLNFYEALAGGG